MIQRNINKLYSFEHSDIEYKISFRFLIGFCFPGVLLQVHILITEVVGNDRRPFAKLVPGLAINIAWMVVGLKMYLLQNWKYLSIACTAPYLFVLVFYIFVPESIRWLNLNNRSDEAMTILRNIARWNNKMLPENLSLATSTNITVHRPNICHVFRVKTVAVQTYVQIYIWMTTALLCYGLQFAAKNLGGSLYLNFTLLAAVGLPAELTSAFVNKVLGRKKSTLISLLLGGTMCVLIGCIPTNGNHFMKTVRVVLGILGKMCGSVTFSSIYLWSAELYPTNVRAVAMGILQVSARVGSAASPWVVNGLAAVGEWIPFVVIGIVTLVGAAVALLLPETKGTVMKESADTGQERDCN